jgi:hypothetical protein
LDWTRSVPEGSAASTKGKKWGARWFGKTREDTVRTEMCGGPMRATNASPTSPGVETLGMLPRMTHGDDGGGEVGDAMCGWSWSRSRKQNKRRRAMKKNSALGCRGVIWRVGWVAPGVEEGVGLR